MGQFQSRIEAFLRRHGMPHTRLGLEALNDVSFVGRLRRGRSPRLDTAERVESWMAAYDLAHPVADVAVAA